MRRDGARELLAGELRERREQIRVGDAARLGAAAPFPEEALREVVGTDADGQRARLVVVRVVEELAEEPVVHGRGARDGAAVVVLHAHRARAQVHKKDAEARVEPRDLAGRARGRQEGHRRRAADVDRDAPRGRVLRRPQHERVERAGAGRPLAAGRDVRRPKIADGRPARRLRDHRHIAELPVRVARHRLPVRRHQIDGTDVDAGLRQQIERARRAPPADLVVGRRVRRARLA